MADPDPLISHIATVDDDEFRRLINEDIRRKDGEGDLRLAAVLRSPELAPRYYANLVRTLKNVEGQLAARESEYEALRARLKAKLGIAQSKEVDHPDEEERRKAHGQVVNLTAQLETEKSKYLTTRTKSLRYKTGLDMALVEIRSIIDSQHDDLYDTFVARERNHLAERVRTLEAAIRNHQTAMIAEGDAGETDELLWKVLAPAASDEEAA